MAWDSSWRPPPKRARENGLRFTEAGGRLLLTRRRSGFRLARIVCNLLVCCYLAARLARAACRFAENSRFGPDATVVTQRKDCDVFNGVFITRSVTT